MIAFLRKKYLTRVKYVFKGFDSEANGQKY